MGRPREHDEQTRAALRAAAERLVATGGPDALTVRAVAAEVGTTTRAIYSVFGSKDALVASLAEQAFELLRAGLDGLPETNDPADDLIQAGATMYRSFVRDHPSLFRIAFQRIVPELTLGPELTEARARSWARLEAKVQRVADAGLIGTHSVNEAPSPSTRCARASQTPNSAAAPSDSSPQARASARGATHSKRSYTDSIRPAHAARDEFNDAPPLARTPLTAATLGSTPAPNGLSPPTGTEPHAPA